MDEHSPRKPVPGQPVPAPPDADGGEAAPAASAVSALVRALATFDSGAGRIAAHRASIADDLAVALHLAPAERQVVLATALLADIGMLATRTAPPAGSPAWPAVLGATMVELVPGLESIATALRHIGEQWDGSGAPHGLVGEMIPRASRVVAVAESLRSDVGTRNRNTAFSADPAVTAAATEVIRSGSAKPLRHLLDLCAQLEASVAESRPSANDITPLSTIGEIIDAIEDVEEVLALIAEHARRSLGALTVSIARLDHDQGFLQVLVNVGELGAEEERFPQEDVYSITDLPELEEYRAGATRLRRASRPDDAEQRYLAQRGLSSEAVVPLMLDGDAWGIVWATTSVDQAEFTPVAVQRLQDVARQMSAGVARAKRFHELEQLSFHDALTGLGNRLVLNRKLADIFSQPAALRQAAVIICDVDNLKDVNDVLGHQAGDDVLVGAGRALGMAVEHLDDATVCRMGGDEFCIIINGPDAADAQDIAEQALAYFRSLQSHSFSCGVAMTGPDIVTPSELLEAADQAQYERKHRHRNEHKAAAGEADRTAPPLAGGSTGRRARRDH